MATQAFARCIAAFGKGADPAAEPGQSPAVRCSLIESVLGRSSLAIDGSQLLRSTKEQEAQYFASLDQQAQRLRHLMALQRRMLSGSHAKSAPLFCVDACKLLNAEAVTLYVVVHSSMKLKPVFSSDPARCGEEPAHHALGLADELLQFCRLEPFAQSFAGNRSVVLHTVCSSGEAVGLLEVDFGAGEAPPESQDLAMIAQLAPLAGAALLAAQQSLLLSRRRRRWGSARSSSWWAA